MRGLTPVFFFIPFILLVLQSGSFELQDTIHELIEENIHLHDQLENLTQALRELKRMLSHHSNGTESSTRIITDTTNIMTRMFSICGMNGQSTASVQKPICCWSMPFVDMTCMAQLVPSMKEQASCC
ncbi:hypothetical protein PAMP_013122 [Pampus punctatissimus]